MISKCFSGLKSPGRARKLSPQVRVGDFEMLRRPEITQPREKVVTASTLRRFQNASAA
jgi:hypothetical protein